MATLFSITLVAALVGACIILSFAALGLRVPRYAANVYDILPKLETIELWLLILVAIFGCLAMGACGSLLEPSVAIQRHVCITQPREYYNPTTGVTTVEKDWYYSDSVCPSVPIQ